MGNCISQYVADRELKTCRTALAKSINKLHQKILSYHNNIDNIDVYIQVEVDKGLGVPEEKIRNTIHYSNTVAYLARKRRIRRNLGSCLREIEIHERTLSNIQAIVDRRDTAVAIPTRLLEKVVGHAQVVSDTSDDIKDITATLSDELKGIEDSQLDEDTVNEHADCIKDAETLFGLQSSVNNDTKSAMELSRPTTTKRASEHKQSNSHHHRNTPSITIKGTPIPPNNQYRKTANVVNVPSSSSTSSSSSQHELVVHA